MASQYVSQQWSNLPAGVAGPGGASLERTQEDNPDFKYPGRFRRDLGGGNPQIIQRGFMRSLLGSVPLGDGGTVSDALGNSRFFFQFNPQQIQRAVSVSGGLMNPLLQDPGQFSVATPGNATFSFDIFLNREAEVNAQSNYLVKSRVDPDDRQYRNGSNTYEPSVEQDPGRYGVLSDIQVLDNIIGQGITQKTIAALAKIQSLSSSWDTSETSAGASVTGAAENYKTAEEMNAALTNIQFGNSAFLISTPVRIVFSSMFMIDGFIQGSNVMFSKFSGDMVPTVCAINITVEAKYIGFAKEKTYLTESLASAVENANKEGTVIAEPIVGDQAEYDLLRTWLGGLPDYQIGLAGVSGDDYYSSDWTFVSDRTISEILGFGDVRCMFGFRDNVNETGGDSTIAKAFQEGKYGITIEHTPEVYVWRSFVTDSEAITATNNGKTESNTDIGPGKELKGVATGFAALTGANQNYSRDVLLLALNPATAVATSIDSWAKFHAYGGATDEYPGETDTKSSFDIAPQGKQSNAVYGSAKVGSPPNIEAKDQDSAQRAYISENYYSDAADYKFIIDMKVKIKASISSLINNKQSKRSEITFEVYKTVLQDADKRCIQLIQIDLKDVPKG